MKFINKVEKDRNHSNVKFKFSVLTNCPSANGKHFNWRLTVKLGDCCYNRDKHKHGSNEDRDKDYQNY